VILGVGVTQCQYVMCETRCGSDTVTQYVMCDARCGSDTVTQYVMCDTCNVTLGVRVTGYVRVTKQVRVTVQVWDYKICIESGIVKSCNSDTSIGNDRLHD